MSSSSVGSLCTGNVPTAIRHLYRGCQLLRSGHPFLDSPPGVHQELPVFFHDLNLKALVLIGLRDTSCFLFAVVQLPIPQELLSIADHYEIRAHTMPPAWPLGSAKTFSTWSGIGHLAVLWSWGNTRRPATPPLAARRC